MENSKLKMVLKNVKESLSNYYKDKLESIILYGSQARGDAKEDSDIDLLVILKSMVHPCDEMDKTTDFMAQICLDYDVVISWQFLALDRFQNQDSPFIFNVKKEGILI